MKKTRALHAESLSVNILVASIAIAAALLPIAALANAHVELTETATAIESHNGKLVPEPIGRVTRHGERLRYTIVAKNTGDRAAVDLSPVAKIPAGERFVAGSAGATAQFSVDGGKTWSRKPMVRVNAIRWLDPLPLMPGARVIFAYDVIVA
jgi:uncharacterized repeat protein (TIGR01451 family)